MNNIDTKRLTEVYTVDFSEAVRDEYGLYYSKDYKRLLSYKNPVKNQEITQSWTKIIIHPKTEIICENAFCDYNRNSDNPSELILPEGLKVIGNNAFSRSRFSCLTLPSSLNTIYENPFSFSEIPIINNYSDYFKIQEGIIYDSTMRNLIHCFSKIESFISAHSTTCIKNAAFACQPYLKTIILSSVEEIGMKAFYNCPCIEHVIFSDNLKIIGAKAFKQRITDLDFTDEEYFYDTGKRELLLNPTEIIIPTNTIKLGVEAFARFTNIKSRSANFVVSNNLLLSADGKVIYNCLVNSPSTIVVPDSVESIMGSAFEGCQSLERLIISRNVKYIGNKAFRYCYGLKSVYFESDNVELGEFVFSDCINLINVSLPKEIKVIPDGTFSRCRSLKRIIFPDFVTTIGEDAFWGCGFHELHMPKDLKYIGKYAFQNCVKLEHLLLNKKIEEIGAFAFSDCNKIKDLYLSENLKRIGTHAFNLQTKVTISSQFTYIEDHGLGSNYFDLIVQIPTKNTGEMKCGCEIARFSHIFPLLRKRTLEERMSGIDMGKCCFLKYDEYGGEEIDEAKPGVYSGDMECFISLHDNYSDYTHKTIRRIVLDERVKYICNRAFAKYSSGMASFSMIKPVVLHNSIIAIGDCAFEYTSIDKIELPRQLEYIGDYAFRNTFYLDKIVIPQEVSHIGINPFADPESDKKKYTEIECLSPHFKIIDRTLYTSDMKRLIYCFNKEDEIIVPSTVESIDDYAFSRLPLKSIIIPYSVKTIGKSAFQMCEKLENIKFNNVRLIGEGCFLWCESLKKIIWPYTEELEAYMFAYCKNLKSIEINQYTKSIKERAFKDCVNLSKITLSQNIVHIDDSAFSGSGIRTIICESSYFEIKDDMLFTRGLRKLIYCFSKKSMIIIPDGVVEVSNEAFANNKMKSVLFPPSIQILGERIFDGCSNLVLVDLSKTNIKKLGRYTMMNCKSNPQIRMRDKCFMLQK